MSLQNHESDKRKFCIWHLELLISEPKSSVLMGERGRGKARPRPRPNPSASARRRRRRRESQMKSAPFANRATLHRVAHLASRLKTIVATCTMDLHSLKPLESSMKLELRLDSIRKMEIEEAAPTVTNGFMDGQMPKTSHNH